ncbi:hypothetical protein Bca4012_010250 [Brassica carinata]
MANFRHWSNYAISIGQSIKQQGRRRWRRVAENKLQRRKKKKKRLEMQETIGKPDFIEIKGVTLWMVSVFYLFSSIPPLLLHTNHNLYMLIGWKHKQICNVKVDNGERTIGRGC